MLWLKAHRHLKISNSLRPESFPAPWTLALFPSKKPSGDSRHLWTSWAPYSKIFLCNTHKCVLHKKMFPSFLNESCIKFFWVPVSNCWEDHTTPQSQLLPEAVLSRYLWIKTARAIWAKVTSYFRCKQNTWQQSWEQGGIAASDLLRVGHLSVGVRKQLQKVSCKETPQCCTRNLLGVLFYCWKRQTKPKAAAWHNLKAVFWYTFTYLQT